MRDLSECSPPHIRAHTNMGSAQHKGCTRITPSTVCSDSKLNCHLNCYHHCFLATSITWWHLTILTFFRGKKTSPESVKGVVKWCLIILVFRQRIGAVISFIHSLIADCTISDFLTHTSLPFCLVFPLVCFLGVGRTVWRVRVQQPLFLTSWSEHVSWRASI